MLDVRTYIKIILEKKKMSNVDLRKKLNKLEQEIGECQTTAQQISEYMLGVWEFGERTLAKYEYVLGLKEDTLTDMIKHTEGRESRKSIKEYKDKIREVRKKYGDTL